tara:strand:- start:1913 stop:2449 length:537 start_codon:yes stop_codon:yes gene_type:complete
MKYQMDNGEKKTDFATRLITEQGEFMSAKDAYELVDKRTTTMSGWQAFQANLSDAVRKGNLAKKRGEDSAGKRRVLYGPKGLELLYDPRAFGPTGRKNDLYVYEPYPLPVDFTERLVDTVKVDKPSIEDIPLGKLLEFNGTERDDIMSVIEDWLFDTSLRQLRDKYPILETYIKEMLR